ncbi:hypothetical protein ACP70R_017911 [Stipagrostis hirtigluma subsp. patula]
MCRGGGAASLQTSSVRASRLAVISRGGVPRKKLDNESQLTICRRHVNWMDLDGFGSTRHT